MKKALPRAVTITVDKQHAEVCRAESQFPEREFCQANPRIKEWRYPITVCRSE